MMKDPIRDAIRARRSVRAYTEQAVDEAVLKDILECAMWAPSARNMQPWHLCVVQDQNLLSHMNFAIRDKVEASQPDRTFENDESFFYHAPVAVFVCAQEANVWSQGDCGMLAQNMQLAAHSYGLGTCVIGMVHLIFQSGETESERWLSSIGAPAGYRPQYAVLVGHPAQEPPAKERDMSCVNYV